MAAATGMATDPIKNRKTRGDERVYRMRLMVGFFGTSRGKLVAPGVAFGHHRLERIVADCGV